MCELDKLLQWAAKKDITLNGIKLARIPGRGTGIIAERRLEAGEIILTVPTRVIRSLDSVPQSITRRLPPSWSIQSLLALDLIFNDVTAPWRALLPNLDDLRNCIPLLWPAELQALLPRPAFTTMEKQRKKIQMQWDIIRRAFPSLNYNQYLESWLIINSRTFYHLTTETEKYEWEERVALLPIADLLNHSEAGCQVLFDDEEYTLTTDRVYGVGEEVNNSYGEHSNDFLLAEYGFVLTQNCWDEVCIDEAILPFLEKDLEAELRDAGALGGCKLRVRNGPCERTIHVLRLIKSKQHLEIEPYYDGPDEAETLGHTYKALLSSMLERYLVKVMDTINTIRNLQAGELAQRELLAQRWSQIQAQLERTLEN